MRAFGIRTTSFAFAMMVPLSWSAGAAAREVDEREASRARCPAAYEAAQVLRKKEHLLAARAQLLVCKESCPGPLVKDCSKWLSEVDALTPSVRLVFKSTDGKVASADDVKVSMDGYAIAATSAAPFAVDPGVHVFRFERPSEAPVETRAEIHSGEREHEVAVVLPSSVTRSDAAVGATVGPASGDADASSFPARSASRESKSPSYVAPIVFGSLSVALGLAAGVLAVKGAVDRADLRSSCAPFCDQSETDRIRTMWWTAAGLGGGAVLAATAALVFWPRHRANEPTVEVGPRSVSLRVPLP